MAAATPINPNSFAALCDGTTTILASQPNRVSGGVVRARRRVLFGAQLPASPAGNTFADLYNADGTQITFGSAADARRVAGNPVNMPVDLTRGVVYPQTVELAAPWALGAPGQVRDIHFAFALYVQLMTAPSTSTLFPGPNDLPACDFTARCRPHTPEYRAAFAADRALREMCTVPVFKHPKVLMMPIKHERAMPGGRREQAWFPWQTCTNCLAGRAVGRCSLWVTAIRIQTPLRVLALALGAVSDWDTVYGYFTDMNISDVLLNKDLGYYELWMCRDGVARPLADG